MTTPSIKKNAFTCPHCGALAHQYWFSTHADLLARNGLPVVLSEKELADETFDSITEKEEREEARIWAAKMMASLPFLEPRSVNCDYDLGNVWLSQCYSCEEIAIWLRDRVIYPQSGRTIRPSSDMPIDIRRDFDEAGKILDHSPRGAAALLRLAIQKLCKELGQPGRNINDDIGALVKDGLDRRVQQALDAVRVIGNSAVHPGQIDIRDDRETAEALFKLLNLIVEKTISEPKHVQELYDSLPAGALEAIKKRDEGAGTE